ncbi:MAG: aminotransferase class I/II-fold pyridoxal phosphate-dependent enzyme [Acidimicrobiaceae bacterium]|nr:aminotransferase class I/II-fold pyridoxal phosphate-dependent enzyme [Acidimicrobiaceae bacterium]
MTGFTPPVYPYDRLEPARAKAAALPGGVVDLSVGTPTDPPPAGVLDALADADRGGSLRGYPPSIGTPELRQAIQRWTQTRFGVALPAESVAVCVGTKELVASIPHYLHLRTPGRDTVLYPAVSYPTYEMGARLGGLRAVPVPLDAHWRLDLAKIPEADAARALLLWANTPGNPTGALDDLGAVAAWGRARDIPVFSDECYAVFTWDGPPRTCLEGGLSGVVAVHSLSKRSNLAGMRVGWYAGDPELVGYLREVRKHAGMMVPGPAQHAAAAALADEAHVEAQRARYLERLERMRDILAAVGVDAPLPAGGFYLWAPAPDGDTWSWTDQLAATGGVLVSPGEFYGAPPYARLAMVASMDRLDLVASRLGVSR